MVEYCNAKNEHNSLFLLIDYSFPLCTFPGGAKSIWTCKSLSPVKKKKATSNIYIKSHIRSFSSRHLTNDNKMHQWVFFCLYCLRALKKQQQQHRYCKQKVTSCCLHWQHLSSNTGDIGTRTHLHVNKSAIVR